MGKGWLVLHVQCMLSGIDLGRTIAILTLIFRKWHREKIVWAVYANYIGPSVMTDAN